jgi:positive regulator of sigma E activity
MWELLRDSCGELASRPIALLKCFGLTVVLYWLAHHLFSRGVIVELEALTALVFVFVFVTVPGVVRWHRHLIADEMISWLPRPPDVLSLIYVAKLLVATFVLLVIKNIASSIANDLVMPIYGLIVGGREIHLFDWLLAPILTILISVAVFVLLFGKWMLHLPEGTLDPTCRGARGAWPSNGKRSFLRALSLVYLIPPMMVLVQENFMSDDFVTTTLMNTLVGVICALVGFSILTVAYRKNMENAGLTRSGIQMNNNSSPSA